MTLPLSADLHSARSARGTTSTVGAARARVPPPAQFAERPARVRMRYVPGITSAMRVIYLDRSDRVMKIIAQPVELGRKFGLEFMAADFTTTGNAT